MCHVLFLFCNKFNWLASQNSYGSVRHLYSPAKSREQPARAHSSIVPESNIQIAVSRLPFSETGNITRPPEDNQNTAGNIMKKLKKISRTSSRARIPLSKPGVFSLFVHIARAALTGGMLWVAFFAGLILVYLHVNHFPTQHLPVLLIAAVVVIAFVRGIREWQQELDEYQRDLTVL